MSNLDTTENLDIQKFKEFIVITNNEQSFSRAFKQNLFPNVRYFNAPSDALYHIFTHKEKDKSYSALLFCEQELEDIYATLIVSLLLLHPLGSLFPVVVIFDKLEDETDRVLIHQRDVEKENLRTLGAFNFLEPSYTSNKVKELAELAYEKYVAEENKYKETLETIQNANEEAKIHFQKAWKERIQNFEKNFVRFFYLPDNNASYEEVYLIGKQKYYDRLFNQATVCFERSSESPSPRKADSYVYLYAIQKENVGAECSKNYLEKAITAFIEKKDWGKVEESVNLFSRDFPREDSPLYEALANEFSKEHYDIVNAIIDNNKQNLKMNKVAEILMRSNNSTTFPPEIVTMLNRNSELKQIIFQSNLQENFDDEAYLQDQQLERTLRRLQLQKEARLRGEGPKLPPREVRSQEKIVLNTQNIQNILDNDKKKTKLEKPSYPLLNDTFENEKQEEKNLVEDQNSSKTAMPKNMPFIPPFGEENKTATVEGVPTIYLKNNSFIGDIINMTKYTRKLYKNK